jgi:AraC family transcriptional regulator, regulatory protein of adaptative response / DNA-3-methyladenine glycosylase II
MSENRQPMRFSQVTLEAWPRARSGAMHEDRERCVRAVQSKDARFDGWFFTAVRTTGIYCRPSCPVVPPKAENMRFYPSAAAAQQAGFRACKRCRPDATPGSPEWNERADLVARAMRLIKDGVVDRDGVPGLASRLGYSTRQIERQLLAEVGAGPLALARAQRAQAARLLIETSTLPMADVAFAAGFSAIRTFNETVREVFALSPTQLRGRSRPEGVAGALSLRLPFRTPLHPDGLFGQLVAAAVPGVEEWRSGAYRRTLRLPHGHGIAELRPTAASYIECRLSLSDLRDLTTAINRCRRLLDLDADPAAVDELLGGDPVLAPLVRKNPGRRVPHTVDEPEAAVRAVLGQQAAAPAVRARAALLVAAHGDAVADPGGGLTHLFPAPEALAAADPGTPGLPRASGELLHALVARLAAGSLDLGSGSDWRQARVQLATLPGIRPWTVETIAMRALADPDAFVPADLGVKSAAASLGLPSGAAALVRHAAAWRPWRAYAVQHLRATQDVSADNPPARDVVAEQDRTPAVPDDDEAA